jgi:hypothetical protein
MEILSYIFIFFIIILLLRSLQNQHIIKEKKTKTKALGSIKSEGLKSLLDNI